MKKTDNLELNKPDYEDKADIAPINENMDKIDLAFKTIEIEAKNKDGGNADTVDGHHASEFTKYREFNSLDELAKTQYEGLFYIGGSDEFLGRTSGISFESGRDIDIQPDKTDHLQIYTRIYFDNGKEEMYAAEDVYNNEADRWTRKSLKIFSFDGHSHSVSDIEDFPKSLPASGGNADTVDGKHAGDFVSFCNSWERDYLPGATGIYNNISGRQTADLPNNTGEFSLIVTEPNVDGHSSYLAFEKDSNNVYIGNSFNHKWRKINDGGNADTVGGKQASDFALKNHSHTDFSAWESDSDRDASWGVSISASGINFQWNDDTNDSELHISENGLRGGGSFLPAVSNFGNISAESFSGNGSNLTNVNADTVDGKHAADFAEANHTHKKSDIIDFPASLPANGGNADTIAGKSINVIQTRDSGYCFYNQNKDWNDLTDTGYYGLMHSTSTDLHNPVNGKFFYPMVFKYAADSLTQLAIPHSAGENKDFGEIYIRSKNSSNGWSGWKSVGGNGCIRTVSFTAPTGSNWYRIITNDGDICSGIFTISGGVSNYSSATVFSASQCYNGTVTGTAKLVKLSHAAFNSFITKIRLVKPSTDNYYIDIYASNSGTANLKVTFNGIGWKILDNITTANASAGFSYSEEITL